MTTTPPDSLFFRIGTASDVGRSVVAVSSSALLSVVATAAVSGARERQDRSRLAASDRRRRHRLDYPEAYAT